MKKVQKYQIFFCIFFLLISSVIHGSSSAGAESFYIYRESVNNSKYREKNIADSIQQKISDHSNVISENLLISEKDSTFYFNNPYDLTLRVSETGLDGYLVVNSSSNQVNLSKTIGKKLSDTATPLMILQSPGTAPPGREPPGREPPGTVPPGREPPGTVPPGGKPPGREPPGTVPPGGKPPGTEPPGMEPPGGKPPGTVPPGMEPPGSKPPGTEPPGSEPPGRAPPGTVPPGREPPGGEPPGREPPGTVPPGSEPPGGKPPGMEPPGTVPPGSEPPGGKPPGMEPPGSEPPGSKSPSSEPPGKEPPGSSDLKFITCTKYAGENTLDPRYHDILDHIEIVSEDLYGCNHNSTFRFMLFYTIPPESVENTSGEYIKKFSGIEGTLSNIGESYFFDQDSFHDREGTNISENSNFVQYSEKYSFVSSLFHGLEIRYLSDQYGNYLTIPTVDGWLKIASRSKSTAVSKGIGGIGFSPESCTGSPIPDCFVNSVGKSQILYGNLGTIINCMINNINYILFPVRSQDMNCIPNSSAFLNSFPYFQNYMKQFVFAALTLYIMFYGFQILLNLSDQNREGLLSNSEIFMAIMKVVFVIYLSIGLPNFDINNKDSESAENDRNGLSVSFRVNGIEEYVLPITLGLINQVSEFVFSSLLVSNNNLCNFERGRYVDINYYLWDIVECRILSILGVNSITDNFQEGFLEAHNISLEGTNFSLENTLGVFHNPNAPSSLKVMDNLNIFTVIGYMMLIPNFYIHISASVLFAVVVIFIYIFLFVTSYLMSIFVIYLSLYLSPILIPSLLFDKTRHLFEGWYRILVSFVVLPIVTAAFVAIILFFYDQILSPGCSYSRQDYIYEPSSEDIHIPSQKFSTFKIGYNFTEKQCSDSILYQLIEYYYGHNWSKYKFLFIFSFPKLTHLSSLMTNLFQLLYVNILFALLSTRFLGFLKGFLNIEM